MVLYNSTQCHGGVNERDNKNDHFENNSSIRAERKTSLRWDIHDPQVYWIAEFKRCWHYSICVDKFSPLQPPLFNAIRTHRCDKQRPLFTQAFSQSATNAAMSNNTLSSALNLTKQNNTKATLTSVNYEWFLHSSMSRFPLANQIN